MDVRSDLQNTYYTINNFEFNCQIVIILSYFLWSRGYVHTLRTYIRLILYLRTKKMKISISLKLLIKQNPCKAKKKISVRNPLHNYYKHTYQLFLHLIYIYKTTYLVQANKMFVSNKPPKCTAMFFHRQSFHFLFGKGVRRVAYSLR